MRTLDDWLNYQQTLHSRGIDLGLDRVRRVAHRMGKKVIRPAPIVITVGGTNGKGSTVAFLSALLTAARLRIGSYTSPHLLRYNERVQIAGKEVTDVELIEAFERIEAARGDTPLTYFEFGTLAALWIFLESNLDIAILEVGLGGRLDAVNIVDADCAVITTVDLDHQEFLGYDRESIAREKAGIFRPSRPAIIAELNPPKTLLEEVDRIGAIPIRAGRDYVFEETSTGWVWRHIDGITLELPRPNLLAPCQIPNAGGAIAALYALRENLGWNIEVVAKGIENASLPGRLQHFHGEIDLIVDVAHNPQATTTLAAWAAQNPISGRTHAAFSALADKDILGIVTPLRSLIDHWHVGGLIDQTPRGLPTIDLADCLATALEADKQTYYETISAALTGAFTNAHSGDRVLAFGSFYVATVALEWAAKQEIAIKTAKIDEK